MQFIKIAHPNSTPDFIQDSTRNNSERNRNRESSQSSTQHGSQETSHAGTKRERSELEIGQIKRMRLDSQDQREILKRVS